MLSTAVVFWDVDTQADFMLPGGKLYVPGAEKIVPNLRRLVDAARQGDVLLVSSADAHTPQDEEFRQWPPHCLVGTPGQKKIPETLTETPWVVPNRPGADLPANFDSVRQFILEKQKLDVFTNANTEAVLARLGAPPVRPEVEFVVFGVVTEYCVRCAAAGLLERGRRVAIVTDAIQTLDPAVGRRTLEELTAKGGRLVTAEQALALVEARGVREN
jgi:nicotinamidase/pyrazinamidase